MHTDLRIESVYRSLPDFDWLDCVVAGRKVRVVSCHHEVVCLRLRGDTFIDASSFNFKLLTGNFSFPCLESAAVA